MPTFTAGARQKRKFPTRLDDPPTTADLGRMTYLFDIAINLHMTIMQRDRLAYKVHKLDERLGPTVDHSSREYGEAETQLVIWRAELTTLENNVAQITKAGVKHWMSLGKAAKRAIAATWGLDENAPLDEEEAAHLLQKLAELPDGPVHVEAPFLVMLLILVVPFLCS